MGRKARETVREKFLLTRYVEQYLDLFAGFEANFSCVIEQLALAARIARCSVSL